MRVGWTRIAGVETLLGLPDGYFRVLEDSDEEHPSRKLNDYFHWRNGCKTKLADMLRSHTHVQHVDPAVVDESEWKCADAYTLRRLYRGEYLLRNKQTGHIEYVFKTHGKFNFFSGLLVEPEDVAREFTEYVVVLN